MDCLSRSTLSVYREVEREKKRILLLIPTFADEGGTQKMVYELGRLLTEWYEVYECSFNAGNESHVFKGSNPTLSLDSKSETGFFGKIVGYYKKAIRLRQLKKAYRINVTISNLWAADLVNILSFTSEKKISVGHINIVGNFQNRLLLRFRWLAGFVYRRFDHVAAANGHLRNELQSLFNLKPEKISFISNFVVLDDCSTPILVHKSGRQRLVNCGRLNVIKNQKPLFRVFAALKKEWPHAQLLIIGDGPLKEDLSRLARQLNLSVSDELAQEADVVFSGFLPNPFPLLCLSDIFVLSSSSEGFGLVLVEAMHAGLPIITSDCPTGGPHFIMEGKVEYEPNRKQPEETPYGYLMPVPTEEDQQCLDTWVKTIGGLLGDSNKINSMGNESKMRAKDFSADKVKIDWCQLIEAH